MDNPFAPGLLQRLPPPRKVVVVRPARIGVVLCATPAFRALRRALPEAEITLVALRFARYLVARSPSLDRYEEFPGFPGMAEQFFEARRATAFFQRMQAERFDLAVQLYGSGVYSNPFALLLGARATAGFIRPGDPPGRLDGALPYPELPREVERLLALTTFLGAPPRGEELEFPLWPEDEAAAERLLAGLERPLLGLHPAGTEATKRWRLERFAAAGAALRAALGGTVVLIAGPGERPLAEAVAAALPGPCVNLAGRTSLPVAGAVIRRLAVLLTNDSGPAHIAYALGTPTVTLFGGTDPRRWGPPPRPGHRVLAHPVPCRPCESDACPIGYACLERITVEQVVQAAQEAVGSAGPLSRA